MGQMTTQTALLEGIYNQGRDFSISHVIWALFC